MSRGRATRVTAQDIALHKDVSSFITSLVKKISDGTHETKEAAVGALRCLAQQNHHEHSTAIFEKGAVPPLVQLLKDGSARAQASACGTLYALSCGRPEHPAGRAEGAA